MPIDRRKLCDVFSEMRTVFMEDPEKAVRSKGFIKLLHDYCIFELKRAGIEEEGKLTIKPELNVWGKYKSKKVDVGIFHEEAGPLLGIAVKSQMSSIGKNFIGYYETLIGDVIGLHDKYPFLVMGQIYLLPLKVIRKDKDGNTRTESYDLNKIEKLFRLITNREDYTDRPEKYEHLAMLVVDFEANPPKVSEVYPRDPTLRVEKFFDKLVEDCQERNVGLL